jgi:O-antigen/teichoic acid export membrane protein
MRRNASWALAGNSVYAACQWAVFVLLVKSFGLADVGVFAYAIAVTGPIFVLANVRLRNLLAAGARSRPGFSGYLAARLLTTAAALIASLAIGVLVSPGRGSLGVLALIALAKGCDAISDICHGLFQRELDMRSAAIGLIANGVLSVVLVAVSLSLWPSLIGATAAYAIGSCAALLAWDLRRAAAVAEAAPSGATVAETLAAAWRLIVTALPLGLSAALGSVQTNLPRYVVNSVLGPAPLAVFAALSYIPVVGSLVVNAVAQAALPLLAGDLKTSPDRYRSRLLALLAAGVALGAASVLCTALVGRPLLAWIYSAAYADQIDVLVWLMVAAGLTYAFVFLGTASTARLRFGAQLTISVIGLATVAAFIGPLVSRFGLAGAAGSLVAGAAVEACAYAALTIYDLRGLAGSEPREGVVPGPLVEGARS